MNRSARTCKSYSAISSRTDRLQWKQPLRQARRKTCTLAPRNRHSHNHRRSTHSARFPLGCPMFWPPQRSRWPTATAAYEAPRGRVEIRCSAGAKEHLKPDDSESSASSALSEGVPFESLSGLRSEAHPKPSAAEPADQTAAPPSRSTPSPTSPRQRETHRVLGSRQDSRVHDVRDMNVTEVSPTQIILRQPPARPPATSPSRPKPTPAALRPLCPATPDCTLLAGQHLSCHR